MSAPALIALPLLLSLVFCAPATAGTAHPPHGLTPDAPAVPEQPALAAFGELRGTLHIAGGSIHVPVMAEAASKIMAQYPGIVITIAGGGSELGVQQAAVGKVNIGSSGRPLTADEKERIGLVEYAFAIDGLAVVVHPSNGVKNLSSQQLADIYAGKITRWKEVGGPDLPINVYSREGGTGTRQCFIDNALMRGSIMPTANVLISNGDMKMSVAHDASAIGFMSVGYADKDVKVIALNTVEPSQRNILTKAYPVVRRLYMNTKGEPQGLTKAFIDYIYSPQGAEAIRRSGYIPMQRDLRMQPS